MKRFIWITFFIYICVQASYTLDFVGKRILYVDSYHAGYAWSDSITAGVRGVIDPSGAELKIFRMDTKNNTSEEFKINAALEAKKVIDAWKPDVVIASDDNAANYLIVPFFKDSETPVVFCGINWDASVYGLPFDNTTGMLEVSPIGLLVKMLQKYAKGDRIGFLESDTYSARKEVENLQKKFGIELEEVFVTDFDQWKTNFKSLQSNVDILIIGNSVNTIGWDDQEAKTFVLENTEIPSGTNLEWMESYALVSFSKKASEQGSWAAETALEILRGTPPSSIPITENKQGFVCLNMSIAAKLGIHFDTLKLKGAKIIK